MFGNKLKVPGLRNRLQCYCCSISGSCRLVENLLMTITLQFSYLWYPFQAWRHYKWNSWKPSLTILMVPQQRRHPGQYFYVNSATFCTRISCLIGWVTTSCYLDRCPCQRFCARFVEKYVFACFCGSPFFVLWFLLFNWFHFVKNDRCVVY